MKKYYEDLLHVILDDYYKENKRYSTIDELGLSLRDAEFLIAKGLCSMPHILDGVYCLRPTENGLTYFEDKKEIAKSVMIHWSFNFAMAVLSAVCGSILTLLIQQAIS